MNTLRRALETEIARLAKNGRVTPEQVVAAARDPANPLHEEFEWDDSVAAHQWRLDQARAIIRSVRVTIEVQDIKVPVISYVRDPEADGQGYRSVVSLRTEEEIARQALASELNRVASSASRAREVALGLGLTDQVEQQLAEAITAR